MARWSWPNSRGYLVNFPTLVKALGERAFAQGAPRWFLMRDAHAHEGTRLLQPRWAMSFMRGPMTRM
jgi:hypothetical protein